MNSEKQSKVEQLIEKTLLPLATWVAQNTYIQILSQTFISLLPMIVIGAFAFIVSKSPINYTGFEKRVVIRVSDKKKNYSKVTKLLVKPNFI